MKTKELPKKLKKVVTEKPYIVEYGALTEKIDGNSILLIFNTVEDYFSKYSVLEKQQTLRTLTRLFLEFGYNIQKVCRYSAKTLESLKGDEDSFKESTGMNLSFSNVIFLLLRINTGNKKLFPKKPKFYNSPYTFYEYPKFPHLLYKKINQAILEKERNDERFLRVTKKLTEKYNFEDSFKGEKYFSVVPQSEKELINEGNNMHNCLVVRHKDVAKNEMHIIFLQKKRNESYIDVIMDNKDKIIYCITDYHEDVKGKDLQLVFHWYKNHVKNIATISEMFA